MVWELRSPRIVGNVNILICYLKLYFLNNKLLAPLGSALVNGYSICYGSLI